jgi:hypothetical protein
VAKCQSRFVLVAVAACLSVTATGCHLHPMDHGFVVQNHWSLMFDNSDPATVSNNDKHCDAVSSNSASPALLKSASPAGQVGGKPELLSRLRSHRLANRFARPTETVSENMPAKYPAGLAITDSRRWHMPPAAPLVLPESTREAEHKSLREAARPTVSVKPVAFQRPDPELALPEASRPDLVLD